MDSPVLSCRIIRLTFEFALVECCLKSFAKLVHGSVCFLTI